MPRLTVIDAYLRTGPWEPAQVKSFGRTILVHRQTKSTGTHAMTSDFGI